jgi:hypothetical protein
LIGLASYHLQRGKAIYESRREETNELAAIRARTEANWAAMHRNLHPEEPGRA